MSEFIDAVTLKKMFLCGVYGLEAKKAWINELNVFPVPDGDTGTNMSLTLMSAVKELRLLGENASVEDICGKISLGTLRGARGNSGVIMSQLCRGFVKVAESHETINKKVLAEAFNYAVATAYKAVMKPKEGTILTVSKAAAARANELADSSISFDEYLCEIIKAAEIMLEKTPTMLPVLKEAGVVDSGGQGLVEFFKGAYDGFIGKEPAIPQSEPAAAAAVQSRVRVDSRNLETSDIKFGYCTEFIILADRNITENDEADIKSFLSSIGDSLVVVSMDGIVKVHVHTNHPGQAFEKGLEYGQLTSMKVDNMREEHTEKVILEADRQAAALAEEAAAPAKEPKNIGFVAVCSGEGLESIYKDLAVDQIIHGGQTMNPSTDDILAAINKVNAENVFVFPNNGNIIMAAQQAQRLCEDKNVIIIPSKTVLQGITSMISFDPEISAEENQDVMTEALDTVKSAEITYAVRDTEIYGKKISNGDYMGIGEGRILANGKKLEKITIETIEELADEDTALITIYYGKDTEEKSAQKVAKKVEEKFKDAEVEVVYGGQPVYYFFISVE